ncbi:MAG: alpha-L-fucosidase [Clostridia bacterium]|nr:alpha-L-fucosidase [Clostridia bacterium]MCR4578604.1 alpha-L-fucosidase [Clostridiales bacterium]
MDWSMQMRDCPQWFKDAKFGMFFHWGVYSVPACENEWYSRNMYLKGSKQNLEHVKRFGKVSEFGYKDFIPMFKGEKFDADEWADLVVRTGAKYAGPVSEHADNYSLWDSDVNPINSVTYMGRDVVGECAEAFRKRGIRFLATLHHQWLWGWFMSSDPEADVYDPKNEVYYGPALPLETCRYMPYRMPDEKFCKVWLEKVREVATKYKPDVLYYDSRLLIIPEDVRREAADIYYNQAGVTDGIMTYKQADFPKGVGVYDVECGRFADKQPYTWQTDDRLEDNITWCIVQDPKYKSAYRILQQLCDVVSKNGNLLLNVGPCADGSFPEEAKKELYKVGDWLKKYGEAIYGTVPFDVAHEGVTKATNEDYNVERVKQQMKDGIAMEAGQYRLTGRDFRFTQKGKDVYVLCMGRSENGEYCVKSLGKDACLKDIASVEVLGAGKAAYVHSADSLTVKLPDNAPEEDIYVIKVTRP